MEYNAHCNNSCEKTEEKLSEIDFDGVNCTVLTNQAAIFKDSCLVNQFFRNLPNELRSLNLTQTNYKKTISLFTETVNHTRLVCNELIEKNCDTSESMRENVDIGSEHILSKLKEINTIAKLKKTIHTNPLFVAPVDKSIGLKWKNAKVNSLTQILDHGVVDATFQYVPILKTLSSLFEHKQFFEKYVKYNQHEKRKCENTVHKSTNEIFSHSG